MKITDFRLENYVYGNDDEIHSIEELNLITEFVRTKAVRNINSISSFTGALLPQPINIKDIIRRFG